MADQDELLPEANDPVEAVVPPPRQVGRILPSRGGRGRGRGGGRGRGRGRGRGASRGEGGARRAAEAANVGTGQAGGRVYRSNFDRAEVNSMLSAIEVHYPVSSYAWERVTELHNRTEPGYNRTFESIRRKFQAIYRMPAPTGDPTIPAYVQRAKALHREIAHRVDLGGGDEEYDLEENAFGPPQDGDEDEDEYENSADGAAEEAADGAANEPAAAAAAVLVAPAAPAVPAAAAAAGGGGGGGLNLRSFNGDEDLLHPQQPLVRRSPHTPRSGRGPPTSLIDTIQVQMMMETRQRNEGAKERREEDRRRTSQRNEEAKERREEDRRRREDEHRRVDEDRRNRNALNETIMAAVGALASAASVFVGGRVNTNNNPVNNIGNLNGDKSGSGDDNNINE